MVPRTTGLDARATQKVAMADYIALGLILLGAIVLFWTRRLPHDVTAVLVLISLILPWPHADGEWRPILAPAVGFSGFGSSAVVMIASMFVFGGALVRTGAAESFGMALFRSAASSERKLQAAVLAATTACSMFVNDTTVVLVFVPLILTVCRERNLAPSRYLMHAAYGSLLGGQWTLIGTRSNVLISEFYRTATGSGLGFFDFTPIAVVIFAIAALHMLGFGRRLLPAAAEGAPGAGGTTEAEDRAYLNEVVVTPASAIIGRTVAELGWEKREDLTVVEVLRRGVLLPRRAQLMEGDLIVVQGRAGALQDLLKTPDVQFKEEVKIAPDSLQSVNLVTVEALVAPQSVYRGMPLGAIDIHDDYRFTVMGVARSGQPLRNRPATLPLQFGDYLLLLGNVDDLPALRRNRDLILFGERAIPALGRRKAVITVTLLAAVIGVSISGLLAPPVAMMLAAVLTILLGCIGLRGAYESVDWPTVITLGAMISYGIALEETGAAAAVAHFLVDALAGSPPTVLLGGLLLVAVLLTQVIENAAVAIVLAPVALEVAAATGTDPKPFMVGLAVAVSAGFCTPVAHESTMLIVGPGGYRFRHYLQLGGVLAIATWLLATLVTPLVWSF
jgi:di/tricarboxylate transporter